MFVLDLGSTFHGVRRECEDRFAVVRYVRVESGDYEKSGTITHKTSFEAAVTAAEELDGVKP